ncbi:DNA methyltransferase [Salinisphaera hydrothermalis]|uniref:DNA methylase N-4/N-6 domain-containing protein n=1 Tax=Salinisphaera hydrothermalis (strain C41B8) TaxID=1304275 RepID=A0A084INQ5_SALHC|nr:DNA methyltransferase [Salinisphaera hydrothermalis]KEZ78339.1 DNA methylase N-4/N-6 domain-containing protein [Salinisphaera hydrothermalis C41B8]
MSIDYNDFLRSKVEIAKSVGFQIDDADINPLLKPHQRAAVQWACAGGCRALFEAFGLGKTIQEIEWVRLTLAAAAAAGEINGEGYGLIVAPLGVRQEFKRDANTLCTGEHPFVTDAQRDELARWNADRPDRRPSVRFIRRNDEIDGPGIYLTNYESVRDGRLDPQLFDAASLDEADCLRGFGGTKTFREFMALFAGDRKTLNERTRSDAIRYRLVATATPSPNDYIELLAYSAFLGVMDVSAAKTRFFKRNSEKADQLTIHPHKEEEFWLWVASWGLFVQKPSDLGFSDEGYELPDLDVRWHEIPTDHSDAGTERDGQMLMFRDAAAGVQAAAQEKRRSLDDRVQKMVELRAEDPAAHRILWHDLEAERHAIERAVPDVVSVYGSQDMDTREQAIVGFSDGEIRELAGKPSMLGGGCNFQRHCSWAIFLGIGFKFRDFIQAIHRLHRFLQTNRVRVDLIYTEAEREVRHQVERKWNQHNHMVARMTEIIRKYGLSHAAMAQHLTRAMGVERVEVTGENYRLINNDCVPETRSMDDDSVDLILTSIPFSTQYEYSPNYSDFGHTDNNRHFWEQMDYLVPELLRVLKPGRVAAIHVKDRIVPSGMTGLGFQTVYPFHVDCIANFTGHGFGYMGMKTIATDVVRENNQTYRLGWTEQCKDGSKMGFGMPEYLLLFRKPPTDTSNSYADEPVVKDKSAYSRSRWQIDAHGYARSSGDRLMTPEEMRDLTHKQLFRLFRDYSLSNVYDYEYHVAVGEALEAQGKLPVTFMLLQPQSWHPDVWTDITRMLTLNSAQSAKGREMHLCPMQFDLADRAIQQWSQPGETVYDPFGGLMTVPYRAVLAGRRGMACELSHPYFLDGCAYVESAARQVSMPSLFDAIENEEGAAA